jgi:serine/threonine-protein kinase
MSTTDLPGSSLLAGRYRLVERLGAGGMSVVWRGFDEVLGRQVAVKVLPPSTSTDPSFRRRLRAEAQAAARLSHPHITNVYDYGEATTVDGEPVPYVVMELVDGESLAAVLARARRLPWPAAVRICSEVSAALAAAHSRGIVHRDVTPANVMLTPAGAKVVDFGISALIGENDIDPDGSLLGTPAYLAPERLEGGQVSPATDVYAVGLLIYRTLIGQLPWDVGTTTALLRAHQYTEPEPLPHVEGLPAAVSALIARCLEKRPDDRPSSAELAHVLAGVAAATPAGRGFVPDWADSSEDTTILPSAQSYTDGIGRIRPGHARVAEAQPSRGVAAVRGGLAAPGEASRVSDAPVSPAPGAAMPISVSDVRAAVDGAPVGVSVAAGSPATAMPPPPSPSGNGPRVPLAGQGGGRNSRFAGSPQAVPAAAAAAAPPAPPGPGPAVLRPAFGVGEPDRPSHDDRPGVPQQRLNGGGTPPGQKPPTSNRSGGGSGPSRSHKAHNNRVIIVAGAVALFGAAAYAWSLTSADSKQTTVSPEPSVLAANGKCVVSYTVWSDDGTKFKASVTVANRDTKAINDWKLWFLMSGDQIVSGNGKEKLNQSDQGVTVTSNAALDPQKSKTMEVTGRYKESNAAPMVFQLDGQTCETYVSGKPGAPSQPVEHLTDGTTRLGPVPTSSTPAPGITILPNGVAVPVPVVSKSTKPTVGSSASVSTSASPDPSSSPSNSDGPPPVHPSLDTSTTTAPTTTPPTTTDPAPPPPVINPDPSDLGA